MQKKWQFLMVVAFVLSMVPVQGNAITYTTEYITSWASCDCSQNALKYTSNQVNYFHQRMSKYGHTRLRGYSNTSVWASDVVEDSYGGKDHWYSDDGDMYVFSGHGGAYNDSNGQYFSVPMCKRDNQTSCSASSRKMIFGERGGSFSTPHSGSLRYLMWLTCESVHTAPDYQWIDTARYGLEYIMGYRGLSADSSTTEEVAEDWVDKAMKDGRTFKSAWFYAIEDWWVNDVGSLVAPGVDANASIQRRDNLTKNWGRRPANERATWMAWSWHQG